MTAIMAAILISAFLLGGCATKDKSTPEDVMKAGALDGAVKAASMPLFKMTCPPAGCQFSSLEVGNPAGAAQMAEIARVAMTPQPSEASQNFRAVVGALTQVGGYGVIGHFATKAISSVTDGYKAGFASNVDIAKQIQAPGAVTTINTTNTNTLSGTGVQGSGTYTAPITTTTTTTNPSPKVCSVTYSATGTPNGFVCSGG
jgi:hypothetical protein